MELRINDYQVTPEITGNFDELKAEVAERVAYYKDLVYTDDQIKEAKADRARLRKVLDAIDNKRKEVKADIMQPYVALESKLDEIKALIQEPINMIDVQIKEYEELQKQEKNTKICETWAEKGEPFDLLIIWNPKWLNTTYSMKKIMDEMDSAIEKFENGMITLEKLTEYQFEAIETFKRTLDLGAAMLKANELKEQAQRKAEYEAQRKAAENNYMNAPEQRSVEVTEVTEEPERKWITFTAYMSYQDALALEAFFGNRNIEFRKGE